MTNPPVGRTYEILEVAELTGLATARLRAWERRYAVIRPARQSNRYRRYTSEQVALLRAFGRLCAGGERIGKLVREPRESVIARAEGQGTGGGAQAPLIEAIKQLDAQRLKALLVERRRSMDSVRFGTEVVLPLADVVGDLWALRRLSVAAEHLASEVVVQLMKQELSTETGAGPLLLAACIQGEQHEWGLLVTLVRLQSQGWRVRYLGPNLPAKNVADAAWTLLPHTVALSGSDPANVIDRLPELRRLPRLLPPRTRVVLGGQGAEANQSRLRRAGLMVGLPTFPDAARLTRRPA
jgi:DNA-binding transcriptional MerR regulator